MAFLTILLVLALVMSAKTLHRMLNDGRPARPPRSHFDDPAFHNPGFRV